MELLYIGQAAKKLGVHPNRLRAWEKQGLINPIRLPSDHRRYPIDEINRILGTERIKTKSETAVLYARVSTKKQADAGNLNRQMERLRQYAQVHNFIIKAEIMDIASGLNQKRRGLANILKLTEQEEYKKLIIEYPDRLARFGYLYIERHLKYFSVEIICITEKEPEDTQSELVRDLLSIVTSFSARLYGSRGGREITQKFQELVKDAKEENQ